MNMPFCVKANWVLYLWLEKLLLITEDHLLNHMLFIRIFETSVLRSNLKLLN